MAIAPSLPAPAPCRRWPVGRIGLVLLGLAALAAGAYKFNQLNARQAKQQQIEETYQQGVKLLKSTEWWTALPVFDKLLAQTNLPKARIMKAATLVMMGNDDDAFATFAGEDNRTKSAYANAPKPKPGWGERDEATHLKRIQILDAALKIEPQIAQLWVQKGDDLLQLVVLKEKAKKPYDRESLIASIRNCCTEALRADPSCQWALDRKKDAWLLWPKPAK